MLSKIFLCAGVISFFLFGANAFAGETELTTYYPAPYGEYNSLQTNRLSVGDANDDGQLNGADQANQDGHIRLKPQVGYPQSFSPSYGTPQFWAAGQTGEIAYSRKKNALYHYNGTNWVE